MHVGLIIYGSLDTLSGGYLYDRELVGRLQACGDQVTLVSLPGQGYARRWLDNWTAGLAGRLAQLPLDVLLQDELCHPSLFAMNRQLRRRARFPLVSIVHHLRSSEAHPGLEAVDLPAGRAQLPEQPGRVHLQQPDHFPGC